MAGGTVGAWSKVLAAEPQIASGEAAGNEVLLPILFAALPLAFGGSATKTFFRAPTIPPATQGKKIV